MTEAFLVGVMAVAFSVLLWIDVLRIRDHEERLTRLERKTIWKA